MGMSQFRPEAYDEFMQLVRGGYDVLKNCVKCDQQFAPTNVRTRMGWRESQISGFCENCWDELFKEPEPGVLGTAFEPTVGDVHPLNLEPDK